MNDKDFFEGISLRTRIAWFAILLGPLVALGVIFALSTKPSHFPKLALFGCYLTELAGLSPPIYIDTNAVRVRSDKGWAIKYSIVNYRGYFLEVGAGSLLKRAGENKYAFDNTSPEERTWRLGPSQGTKDTGLSDVKDFDGSIAMVANDGTQIVYRRSNNPNKCSLRTEA
jgi:hypothetical protein